MKVWIACFLLLFALAQFFDWIEELSLPLPIYILGGAFLAVASNYDKLFGTYLKNEKMIATPVEQIDSSLEIDTANFLGVESESKNILISEGENLSP
ncbi:hypothetical protein [Calothrix sp. 336/3]|uniref:hypothetical protein n=1 Tax=Calothrix sp. 336/3 TaxID=1337936 RepID=UPI000624EF99|nr:hypothetical protein [Calothrix sp. 336/3]AKG21552.1 hypothetical protein IJ00_09945 [Calothrix sp. 336/3]